MAVVAVTVAMYYVHKVLNLIEQEVIRNRNVLNDVEEIKRHLSSMQACLLDAEGGGLSSEVLKNLVEQIRDVSHEMEDVLDEFMIHAPRSSSKSHFRQFAHSVKHWIPVHDLQLQIASIKSKTLSITNSQPFGQLLLTSSSSREGSHTNPRVLEEIVEEDEVLGIDLLKQNLIDHLIDGDARCKTISVVGPGGSGKTVLVNSIYKSNRVIGQFDCHAWLSVPRSSTVEQLLQNLLSQFCMGMTAIQFPQGDGYLKHYLQGKRYIVVLDYVWRDQDWTCLKNMLPDDSNSSRIIVTTRYDDVAASCSASDNLIFRINGLEWKQSWRLFCKKAFGNDSGECPPYLQDSSERIVKRCEGLPQAISSVGSLLSRKPKLPAEWIRVHDNLGREMQANCISTMLLPSYHDLPSNWKSCLLHFSILPEDYSIKRERLIRLWVSEGFVNKSGSEPLEKIAEDYLNELISRNLVNASSRDFSGRVKSCRVLNLVREFLHMRSRDEKFATLVTNSDMDPVDNMRIRRLSIDDASSSGLRRIRGLQLTTVRSLFVFGLHKASSLVFEEALQRVRLLKVLDLENAPLERFPDCILDVALLLRYLSLRNTNVDMVPKNIKRLRYLEYLDLKQTQVTWLPEEICSLHYLQHLLVYRCNPIKYDNFDKLQGVDIVGEVQVLPFLQKLSIIKVNRSPKFFESLRELTMLKKLGLVDLKMEDGGLLCSCIENMQNLSTLDLRSLSKEEYLDLHHINVCPAFLRHLYLKGRLATLPKWIPSLNGLVRLLLRWSKLSTSPIELLQHMPNLMELEMIDAFTGDILFFDTGGFPKLKTLSIEQFDGLDTMVVLNGAMPVLQKLTIVRCMYLWDLPSGIEELTSLEELLLYDMPKEFTSRLGRNSQDHSKVNHVPVIHSFTVGANGSWVIQNFS